MEKTKKKLTTKTLVAGSLLAAMSMVFTRFFSFMIPVAGISGIRVSIGSIPIFISGMLYGPFLGGLTGAVADLVGVVINPQGPYFPGFTLSSMLTGVLPGIFFSIFKRKKVERDVSFITSITIVAIFLSVIIGLFLNNALIFRDGSIYLHDKPISWYTLVLLSLIAIIYILLPMFMKKYNKGKGEYSFDKILFSVSTNKILIDTILNTLWLVILYKKGFLLLLPSRIVSNFITIPIDTIIIYNIIKNI